MSKKNSEHPELEKSEVIEAIPMACADETAAVEFFENQRWGNSPSCPHCQDKNVYAMKARDGARSKRYLWRCRPCGEQFTVRTGTIYEDSRLPLKHWARAFWRACSSKKGVSARQIQRECQITYKSALFLMHRIRFAMTEDFSKSDKLGGTCEVDETYCGGRPRPDAYGNKPKGTGYRKDTNKAPVVAMVERGGKVRTKCVPKVTQKNLRHFLAENIANGTIVNTDQSGMYNTILYPIVKWPGGRHDVVNHSRKEYARHNPDGTVSGVNHCESFFSLLKRGLMGTFHAASKEHLPRYCHEFAFRWNTRLLNDGDRVSAAIKSAEGKRLTYENAVCRA